MKKLGAILLGMLIIFGIRVAIRGGAFALRNQGQQTQVATPNIGTKLNESERVISKHEIDHPLEFPEELGDWTRIEKKKLHKNQGTVHRYACDEPVYAMISIIDSGEKELRSGSQSLALFSISQTICKELIKSHKDMGDTITRTSNGRVSLGESPNSPRMMRAVYDIKSTDNIEFIEHIYTTIYGNQILSIHIGYPKSKQENCELAVKELLNELAKLFASKSIQ